VTVDVLAYRSTHNAANRGYAAERAFNMELTDGGRKFPESVINCTLRALALSLIGSCVGWFDYTQNPEGPSSQ
jgi:hypothetical protein